MLNNKASAVGACEGGHPSASIANARCDTGKEFGIFPQKKDGQYGWSTWSNREQEGKREARTGSLRALYTTESHLNFMLLSRTLEWV